MYKLILVLVFFISFSAAAQKFDTNRLDAYFDTIASTNKGLGEITLSVKDSVYYYRKFGSNGIKSEAEPIVYQIGSVTKVLTSIMVLQLIEEGLIGLEDKIDKYFPNIPNAANISLNNLLSHTSGLNDYVVKSDTSFYWLREPVTDSEIMEEIQQQGTLFEPGEDTLYSNSGYYLLSKILVAERKTSYKEALSKYIIKPLGLAHTRSIDVADSRCDVFRAYQYYGFWEEIPDMYFPNMIGVGDIVSNSRDLSKIIYALFEMKLINSSSLALMKPSEGVMGKGLEKFYFYDKAFYGHSGATVGTKTLTAINPVDNVTITIMLNGAVLPTSEYLNAVLSTLYGKSYTLPSYVKTYAAPDVLRRYEGLYSAEDFPMDLNVFIKDSKLFAQATDQMSFPLSQYTSNEFGFASDGIKIKFTSEKQLVIIQGGQELTFTKVEKTENGPQ